MLLQFYHFWEILGHAQNGAPACTGATFRRFQGASHCTFLGIGPWSDFGDHLCGCGLILGLPLGSHCHHVGVPLVSRCGHLGETGVPKTLSWGPHFRAIGLPGGSGHLSRSYIISVQDV